MHSVSYYHFKTDEVKYIQYVLYEFVYKSLLYK